MHISSSAKKQKGNDDALKQLTAYPAAATLSLASYKAELYAFFIVCMCVYLYIVIDDLKYSIDDLYYRMQIHTGNIYFSFSIQRCLHM